MAIPVKIATDRTSPRLDYVCRVLFNDLLGVDYLFTNDDPHLHYMSTEKGVVMVPNGLLWEDHIRKDILKEIQFESWDNTFCFFKTSSSALPFDIFSAIFFLLSRYEEYIIDDKDAHNRFSAESSILLNNNILQEPLVNIWALKIRDVLNKAFPELSFNPRRFEFRSTLDIDQTWKFKHKGLSRSIAAAFRDVLRGNKENFSDRIKVLLGLKLDPFFNFDWQEQLHNTYKVDVNYFWLLGNCSRYDKNITYANKSQQDVIRSVCSKPRNRVGIHPSYASNNDENQVEAEIKRLKTFIDAVTESRQHFLKLSLPKTYEVLIKHGIQEDHTLGYSTHHGFRAGIAAPFPFFNLLKNESTSLTLVPFCVMDITSPHYYQQNPDEAIATIKRQMDKVAAVGGLFVSLWHNESLSETERWKNWRRVYEEMIRYGAYLTTL